MRDNRKSPSQYLERWSWKCFLEALARNSTRGSMASKLFDNEKFAFTLISELAQGVSSARFFFRPRVLFKSLIRYFV